MHYAPSKRAEARQAQTEVASPIGRGGSAAHAGVDLGNCGPRIGRAKVRLIFASAFDAMTPAKQLEALVMKIGGTEKPTLADVKNILMRVIPELQSMEDENGVFQLNLENAVLKKEIDTFKTQLAALEEEADALRAEQTRQAAKDKSGELCEKAATILRHIAESAKDSERTPAAITFLLDMNSIAVDHYLDQLRADEMIELDWESNTALNQGPVYIVARRGRAYLVNHNLLGDR
jgi:predicted RNase H-like nuclease (RuvC/YqgF family)